MTAPALGKDLTGLEHMTPDLLRRHVLEPGEILAECRRGHRITST